MKKLTLLLALALAACNDKATLDQSQVEYMTVEGRKYEIRVASAGVSDEYRLLIVRATLVINPDPEAERARNQNVANRVMDRTCKGRQVRTLANNLVDEVNLEIHFRCIEVRGG
jgi:hypothetical protein